jgi:hypothetical protein
VFYEIDAGAVAERRESILAMTCLLESAMGADAAGRERSRGFRLVLVSEGGRMTKNTTASTCSSTAFSLPALLFLP